MFYNSVLTIIVLKIASSNGQEPVVHTKFGHIEGSQKQTSDNTALYVFSGIPYAKPPVGVLRFKDPVPITEPYARDIFQPNKQKEKRCVQCLPGKTVVIGTEDCLTLNIYTTSLNTDANYDVLVFIHGGAFVFGAGHSYSPEYLYERNKKLVFVSINYRLGIFGFLSTGDGVVPGNMGLKDQAVALAWVKDNIDSFGGNPQNIVLAGISAGAISVHLHYLSPMSRHLFAKGIAMSSLALSPAVKTFKIKEYFNDFAKLFPDCHEKRIITDVVNCLITKDATELMNKFTSRSHPLPDFTSYENFGPVIEQGSAHPFLEEHPFHLLRKGKVKDAPLLASFSSGEGLFLADQFTVDAKKMETLDEKWQEIAPHLLIYNGLASDNSKINEKVKTHYFGDKKISSESQSELIRLIGDRYFMNSIESSIRLHAASTRKNVYMFKFGYKGELSLHRTLKAGPGHTDDLIYIFKMKNFDPLKKDSQIVDIMVKVWLSFVKDGIPDTGTGISWPAISKRVSYLGDINYIQIDNDKPKLISEPHISEVVFWHNLPLNELHVSGDLKVPKYIQDLQKKSWFPRLEQFKLQVIIARILRKMPFAYFLKKRIRKSGKRLSPVN